MYYKELMEMRKIDHSWDYASSNTKYLTHGIHTYPAMMIPQIAKRVIEEYGADYNTGYDPFAGSGSVLLEFQLVKKNCCGTDINPLAIMIAKAKTTNISLIELQQAYKKIQKDMFNFNMGDQIETPNFFNIEFWFKKSVIKELSLLSKSIDGISDKQIQNFFKVCFSETVRKSSNTRGGEFKLYRIPKEKLISYNPQVFEIFQKIVKRNFQGMLKLNEYNINPNLPKPEIKQADITKHIPFDEESIDFIVSSPPYGDSRTTVAYGQFSRLSLQWLEFEENEAKKIDSVSLGGKPTSEAIFSCSKTFDETIHKISKIDEKRSQDVISFFNDFYKATNNIEKVMEKKSTICWVVGNRTVKGVKIPTDAIIADMFKELGYKHEKTFVRRIPSKRMPRQNSPTNKPGVLSSTMNEENIVILKRN